MSFDPHFAPNPIGASSAGRACRPVDLLAFPGFQLLDIAGPMQVFASANRLREDDGLPAAYRLRIVARQTQVAAWAGLTLQAEPLPDASEACDTLVIAGGRAVHQAIEDAELVAWVTARATAVRRVAAVCTGAFLAGAAGLLDGRRAVTHWDSCALLAERFPAARVESDPIFIEDGKLWTSAGVTAGIDLALALVERDLGRAMALAVARELVVFLKRPGGQSQYSAALALQHGASRFESLHGWMRENLADDLSVPALAARAGMSERSFQRRYREATGLPPARAVERLRVEQARTLLADTAQPLKQIAACCGFGCEETMRRSFARHLATTPQSYRERFSGRR
ncbi:AraC family transcriptional regulator [Labrys okinawensis]|uniref:AraC family transcriptional regulator n=1 Tax=Labrys okinawensis TaxID=346911 RepID=A0A2S9Q8D5_9HYPH|nr:GlxA family transcriptional regulator [Labrys okinawensis]PRH85616.1 AraC family transcriptional regulator [Labrys okinawensis]